MASARLFKSDLQMQTPVDMINWTGSGAGAWGWQQLSSVARCEGSGPSPGTRARMSTARLAEDDRVTAG
jgi:hypothetical protein